MDEEQVTEYTLLQVNPTLADLAAIRQFVERSVLAAGCAPEDASLLVLAVDEAITNIIVHGYGGRGGPVEVGVAEHDSSVVIRVRDEAPPFDPTGVPAPDITAPLDVRPPGGLGIYLMRRIADVVIYRTRPEGGNELILVKRHG